MYAIIDIGGKHYKVEKGGDLLVDLMEAKEGEKVRFENVIFYRTDKDIFIGTPYVDRVQVEGKVIAPVVPGEKLTVFKYKQKAHYRRKTGHRQKYTRVQITAITMAGQPA